MKCTCGEAMIYDVHHDDLGVIKRCLKCGHWERVREDVWASNNRLRRLREGWQR